MGRLTLTQCQGLEWDLREATMMSRDEKPSPTSSLRRDLADPRSSVRLRAALSAGTSPHRGYVDVLVERCGVEPDFYVRDMLTWALTRHPIDLTLPRLRQQLRVDAAQPRSQALHTLSKIGDKEAWSAITSGLLRDQDPDVARSAWRAAVALVPAGSEGALAQELASQLGRGPRDVQLSLSRAFAALGEAGRAALDEASRVGNAGGRAHAVATLRLIDHPEEDFDIAVHDAQRFLALTRSPLVDPSHADR